MFPNLLYLDATEFNAVREPDFVQSLWDATDRAWREAEEHASAKCANFALGYDLAILRKVVLEVESRGYSPRDEWISCFDWYVEELLGKFSESMKIIADEFRYSDCASVISARLYRDVCMHIEDLQSGFINGADNSGELGDTVLSILDDVSKDQL